MVTICQTCGDRGYSAALIYCKHCHFYAMHRYCLDAFPVTFEEPVTWFCKDCELKIAKPPSLDNLSPSVEKNSGSEVLVNIKATKFGSIKKRKCLKRLNERKRKKISRSSKSEACGAESNVSIELHEVACEKHPDKDQGLPDMVSSEERAETVKSMTCSVHEQKRPSVIISDEEFETARDEPCEELTNGNFSSPQCDYHVHAQPIIEPIWSGSLSLCHEKFDTVGGLFAHLSSLACPKVFEAAKLLPDMLRPVLLPKSDIWPKGFGQEGPSEDHIALYFFPNNEREEKVFDSLVDEMMKNDLAMRAVFENVELLIFTSFVLPMQFWRFQEKFYLWGVFKGKQALQTEVPGEKNSSSVSKWDARQSIGSLSNCGSFGSGKSYSSFHASVK